MSGYIDLHCHYLPGIDDGVKSFESGIDLLRALASIGYEMVVATPHIRTAMFENRPPQLREAFGEFSQRAEGLDGLPALGLGAEHYFDDVAWELFRTKTALPYPGGTAALIEFPERGFPLQVEHRFFEMNVAGMRPVLAHPERYAPLFKRTEPLDPLLEVGALPLLDLMSLTGKYGRKPKKAAERMLEEGAYYAACSDSHRPEHVDIVAEGIDRLKRLVGAEEAQELLAESPRRILEGEVEW